MSLKPQPVGEIPEDTARVARAVFRKGNVYLRLRDEFGVLYEDQDFAKLFPVRGQPGLPPWRLALVTTVQFIEGLSDRQAAEAVRSRIDLKYLLGLELTDPGFDGSVLSEFRTRLVVGNADHLLLDKMLEHFKVKGLVKARGRQRTDGTHVLGAVRALNLLEFAGETLRASLNDLATVAPDWLGQVAPAEWFERYSRRVEEYRLPKGQAARNTYATTVGEDGFRLLEALDREATPAEWRERSTVQALRLAWSQHFERVEGRVRWRAGQGLPPAAERFQSPYDTEARFSDKRSLTWTGYKVHVTETCDEDSVHLITHVETCYATVPDVSSTADIHQRLSEKHLLPAEHVVDTGYVDADLLVASRTDHGVTLIGPARPNSSWQIRTEGGLDTSKFSVDWEGQRVLCPQGKVSSVWSDRRDEAGKGTIQVRFRRSDCVECEVRALCTRSKRGPRDLVLLPQAQHEALLAAREAESTAQWQRLYDVRAGIEGTISQGVRAFGLREARYRGLARTALQQVAVAAGMNVIRVTAWLADRPREGTRTSRFAGLRAVA